MVRKGKGGRIGAKVFAAVLTVAMTFSNVSMTLPGGMALAEAEIDAKSQANGSDVEDLDEIFLAKDGEQKKTETDEASAASGTSGTEETAKTTGTEKTETEKTETEKTESEDEVEAEVVSNELSGVNTNSIKEVSPVEVLTFMTVSETTSELDQLVDFTQETSENDGIKSTYSKWNFGTSKNTGKTTASGDSIKGIVVGGGSGRVVLDSGKDLNVKTNSTADTTGVVYLPVLDDTNVITITVSPMDSDSSRYVTVGSYDSDVKLVDDKGDTEHQSVTFKADLEDYVVSSAGSIEGRFIPLYSHGNFKVASIELVETDAVTIVDVSGSLSGDGAEFVSGLKFKNTQTEEVVECDVTGGEYSVSLPNGFEYIVSTSGTFDYAIETSDDGNILDLTTGNDKNKEKDFVVVSQDTVKISGKLAIEELDNAKPVSKDSFGVKLVPAKSTLDKVDVTLESEDDHNYTYYAVILPGEEYSIELKGANDYECTQIINEVDDAEVAINVTPKELHEVTLKAVTHNLKAVDGVTAITVKNLDDEYTYSFDGISDSEFSIQVRNGVYEVTEITTTGEFEPYEHFEVDGANVKEMMYLKDTSEKPSVDYKETVSVGEKRSDYTTIYDALDAIKRMDRASGQGVTIILNDDYYQEQVVVDVPDITLKSGLESGSTISWYYGLGGDSYYSAYLDTSIDKNHLFYNEAHAVDRYESATIGQTPGNWGSTVNLKSTATGFKAENITFENSFNYYITETEKQDIAKSGSLLDRTASGADPTLYKSKERACALYNRGAKNIEFNSCNFISSQDTLYTGDANEYSYFYNCTIEGTTDFICGDGNAIFDNCSLVLYGFSDKAASDLVIVASKGTADKGYLFNHCKVMTDKRDAIKTATCTYLGRPWGTSTEKVAFINTVVESELINEKGWTTMNTVPSLNSGLHEFGTVLTDGTAVDLSGRVAANIGTDRQGTAANYVLESADGYSVKDYLSSSWIPSYYDGERPDTEYQDDQAAGGETTTSSTYVLEASTLTAFGEKQKADGDTEKAGTDKYFTLIYSVKSKVDGSKKTFEDGYYSEQRVNFGGAVSTQKNAVKFTTSGSASVKVWWVCGGNDRKITILNGSGESVATTDTATKDSIYLSTLKVDKAGTYYLGGYGGNNYIFKVSVTEGTPAEVVRADWSEVESPVIENVALNESDRGKVDITVRAVVGADGGDKLELNCLNADGPVKTLSSSAEGDETTFTFAPTKSGEYHFAATLTRDDAEVEKTSNEKTINFVYPLTAPQIKSLVNKGNGTVQAKFYSVAEATEYTIYATNKTNSGGSKATYHPSEVVDNVKTEYSYTFVGLNVGDTYEIKVVAKRDRDEDGKTVTDESDASTKDIEVTAESEREWVFSAFGSGVSKEEKYCGYAENDDGSITVWNLNNKGKIVSKSTDGLAFYYTAVPSEKNFTFTATATIDTWAFTNGQEGFGLMAADRVGVNGNNAVFWNNSYMASGTKVEYYYDADKQIATLDETPNKITMKLGLGAQEKIGVTPENLSRLEANDTATVTGEFSTHMYSLETSCGPNGTGTYNLFGKESSGTVVGTVANPLTQIRLRIQKNNTGYFVSYLDENDNVLSVKKFYDTEALNKLDSGNVYVGFFASRTFKATFSNIELTVIDPSEDAPAEERPVTYVAPSYKVISATYSNTAKYTLQYAGNADGVLTITDAKGKAVVDNQAVAANEVVSSVVKLAKGDNTFNVSFKPNEDFCPGGDQYQRLSSYDAAEFVHTVRYDTISDDEKIYVSVDGKFDAAGTENDPVDIYTAVKYVQPGQTIVVKAGTYSLDKTVTIERGIDGTPSKPIKLVTDGGRAIFDFNKKCAGFIFAGNYWYVNGIDCTHSGNSLKGIQVSGSHITIEDVRTYENGNTGLQVSRYLGSDARSEWPSYDLILNCTSYSNADAGYEDADGFAAKLTVGDGVVFDGCIAYNNADDGWDLFAKVETGSIGQVTIQNSVAFANGYGVDGTNEGNGNGFKMGGSSMAGPHKLINSVAWGNKAKGIDSNSGPDIQVYNSMSFNNGANNVALYTNDTANTNYYVDGVISYRTTGTGTNENIKAKGTQDKNNIYGKKNFFWNDGASANSEGVKVADNWFVSLDAPYANASDPYAVAASLRAADGSIDLGNFLKLSDTGVAALAAAGLEASEVAAGLDGSYEAVKDEREISGSSDAAKEDEETEEPEEEEIKGEFVTKYHRVYFVTEEGEKLKGLQKIGGNYYFFKEDGVMLVNAFTTVDDETYYMDSEGKAIKGFLEKYGSIYFFDDECHKVTDRIFEANGDKYRANEKGQILRGNFSTVDDNRYYFGSDGKMVTNTFVSQYGSTYYLGEDGAMLKECKYEVDGKYYYSNAKGQVISKKFATVGNDRFFFGDDGVMVTNTFVSQYGSTYYMGEDGAMYKNVVFTVDGVTYTANASGKVKVKK